MNNLDTIKAEAESLSTHVEMCAMRYEGLDQRLIKLETKIDQVSNKVDSLKGDLIKALMPLLGTIAVSIITLIGTIIVKMN
jgi:predicted  nucleic acid-binding Zn-ribbon protein